MPATRRNGGHPMPHDRLEPAAAAARATGRKRAATEAAAAEATCVPVKMIFVDRAGSAQRRQQSRPQLA